MEKFKGKFNGDEKRFSTARVGLTINIFPELKEKITKKTGMSASAYVESMILHCLNCDAHGQELARKKNVF